MGDFRFEVWPTEYPVVTQHFGVNPQRYAQFGLPGHDGIDIRAPGGTKVFCVAPGEVYRVHNKPTGHNYGIHVRVAHQDGFRTIYAHLKKVYVRKGQIVEAGALLGLSGNTGNSYGAHLHITLKNTEAKKGRWPYNIIDPTPYLLPLLGWKEPTGPFVEGWVLTDAIFAKGKLAQVNTGGATLYINDAITKPIPAGTIVSLVSSKEPFTRVKVSKASIGLDDDKPPKPASEPPPLLTTVDGWAWKRFLTVAGKQAIVGSHGINLREGPDRSAANIGMVKANSTVSVVGAPKGQYLHVRVRRNDFIEPVALPEQPPDPAVIPPSDGYMGWVLTQFLTPVNQRTALTSRLGVNLRSRPDKNGENMGLIKAFATVSLGGPARKEYSPVLIREQDLLNVVRPVPDVEMPDPWPEETTPDPQPKPDHDTTPGWAFTNGISVNGNTAKVARYGINLRSAPRRNAENLGYIPPQLTITVTGRAQGEYTPVRVRDDLLEPPLEDDESPDPDSKILGQARIGLHASADPEISEAEHQEFSDLRPDIIKVLSFHSADDISKLAEAHPKAHFIVRTFLSMSGRNISPGIYLDYTIKDLRRALDQLHGRQVIVELHNEPNVVTEGLGSSWADGAKFKLWWLELLKRYRRALPGVRFIYPGLSPGSTVIGVKQDHVQFLEASKEAVEAADGAGFHAYWSNVSAMKQTLNVIDDFSDRLRSQPLWITEASYKHGQLTAVQRAQEYLRFWRELQKRPAVQGVTFFVASASNPEFADEVWIGKGIGKLVGKR